MAGTYRTTLRIPGLKPFLWTQFLGAFNDNVSKIIVTFVAMAAYGEVQGAAIVAAVFILPFLLFSGYAGYLADKTSKRSVLVAVKVFEIGVMAVAIPGLLTSQAALLLVVMFLMGVHSTFFSPSKYGIVPEIVPDGAHVGGQRPARDEHLRRDCAGNGLRRRALRAMARRALRARRRHDGHRGCRPAHEPGRPPGGSGEAACQAGAQSVGGSLARCRSDVAGSHALGHAAWRGILLVSGRSAPDGAAAVRPAGARREQRGRDTALHAACRRHRGGEPRRRSALGRKDRAGSRAGGLVWPRHLRDALRGVVDLRRRGDQPGAPRLLRRILRRSAERAAPAAARRR